MQFVLLLLLIVFDQFSHDIERPKTENKINPAVHPSN